MVAFLGGSLADRWHQADRGNSDPGSFGGIASLAVAWAFRFEIASPMVVAVVVVAARVRWAVVVKVSVGSLLAVLLRFLGLDS